MIKGFCDAVGCCIYLYIPEQGINLVEFDKKNLHGQPRIQCFIWKDKCYNKRLLNIFFVGILCETFLLKEIRKNSIFFLYAVIECQYKLAVFSSLRSIHMHVQCASMIYKAI